MSHLEEVKLIQLPRIEDPRGSLTFAQAGVLPFSLNRAYWLHDIPGGESRGGHAHLDMEQILIAITGSFTVRISDGSNWTEFNLNRANIGLYIPKMIWRELEDFSTGAVCLALVSTEFAEIDYIRSFEDFRKLTT